MNRKQEYQDLLAELENTPSELEYTVARAQARAKKAQSIRKFFLMPTSRVAVIFIAFVVMVNLSTTFAMACERIPVLRELAAAVSFSSSLSTAVDNEYVQTIGLEQTENGITMRVEYVIVDQKQLNIFYTLQSQEYFDMDATPDIFNSDGRGLNSYSISANGYNSDNGELRQFVVDFVDNDMPDSLILKCRVHDNRNLEMSEPVSVGDEPQELGAPEAISTFAFTLNFDPEYTQQGEVISLNQAIVLDEQNLTVTTVEIYPTHIRVNFIADEKNTKWLKSLSFYFINEKGNRFDKISDGITATGCVDSPMMASHRLESSFFYKSNSLTMFITEVVWLEKDMERVQIYLANGVADKLPEGVELEQATRKSNSWELTFSAIEREENALYQLFGTTYYDEDGNEYSYNSWTTYLTDYFDEAIGKYVETPGVFRIQFALKDYHYDTVYLTPSYSRLVKLEIPVEVKVK